MVMKSIELQKQWLLLNIHMERTLHFHGLEEIAAQRLMMLEE